MPDSEVGNITVIMRDNKAGVVMWDAANKEMTCGVVIKADLREIADRLKEIAEAE